MTEDHEPSRQAGLESNRSDRRAPSRREFLGAVAIVAIVAPAAIAARKAQAQIVRPFPASARLGRFEMRTFPDALLDGEAARLAAGARIYDTSNRIVMPSTLSGTYDVLVERDPSGQIGRVWILTAQEREAAKQRADAAQQQSSR